MNIHGKIIEIFNTQKITEKFQKREFVVEYAENPSYPEYIKFELVQDRVALIDPFKKGDEVTVEFNLKGRKWEDKNGQIKYFNTLQAWKLEEKSPASPSNTDAGADPSTHEPEWLANGEQEDDLPF